MNQTNIVMLGGGMVAGYAAKQLVELGLPRGELAILSADNAVPYERPPLSKSKRDVILLLSAELFQIAARKNRCATKRNLHRGITKKRWITFQTNQAA